MTYATLMVHLDVNQPNTAALRVAGSLAERLEAGVIGIAACQPMQVDGSDGFYCGGVIVAERDIVEDELKKVQQEFTHPATAPHNRLGWRSTLTLEPLVDYLAKQARSADLIVTGISPGVWSDATTRANTGELVMRAGRPVLLVPSSMTEPSFARMVIAWTDAKETRRAVADALPLLAIATHVTIVEVVAEEAMTDARGRVEDVVDWLGRHGIEAEAMVVPTTGDDAKTLATLLERDGADVVIAGAYGHGRVREWAFGGVTRDLLLQEDRMVFLSH